MIISPVELWPRKLCDEEGRLMGVGIEGHLSGWVQGPKGRVTSILGGYWWWGFKREKKNQKEGTGHWDSKGCPKTCLSLPRADSQRAVVKSKLMFCKGCWGLGQGEEADAISLLFFDLVLPQVPIYSCRWCERSSRTSWQTFPKEDNQLSPIRPLCLWLLHHFWS